MSFFFFSLINFHSSLKAHIEYCFFFPHPSLICISYLFCSSMYGYTYLFLAYPKWIEGAVLMTSERRYSVSRSQLLFRWEALQVQEVCLVYPFASRVYQSLLQAVEWNELFILFSLQKGGCVKITSSGRGSSLGKLAPSCNLLC